MLDLAGLGSAESLWLSPAPIHVVVYTHFRTRPTSTVRVCRSQLDPAHVYKGQGFRALFLFGSTLSTSVVASVGLEIHVSIIRIAISFIITKLRDYN